MSKNHKAINCSSQTQHPITVTKYFTLASVTTAILYFEVRVKFINKQTTHCFHKFRYLKVSAQVVSLSAKVRNGQ